MIGTLTLAILVAPQIGQIHSHAVHGIQSQGLFGDPDPYPASQMDMDESSGMMFKEWPEPEDNTIQCNGLESDITITTIFRQSDQNGCYQFKTPGFGGSGYPNAGGGLSNYDCRFVLRVSDN
ncbi:hypothetical protein TCAL_13958, partial [Tigriopus californicus]